MYTGFSTCLGHYYLYRCTHSHLMSTLWIHSSQFSFSHERYIISVIADGMCLIIDGLSHVEVQFQCICIVIRSSHASTETAKPAVIAHKQLFIQQFYRRGNDFHTIFIEKSFWRKVFAVSCICMGRAGIEHRISRFVSLRYHGSLCSHVNHTSYLTVHGPYALDNGRDFFGWNSISSQQ